MTEKAQAVVIGGGVVGCSVLYHLTKMGWRDVVLLERDELTSGSTWHAAGGMHTLNGDPNVAKLQHYTIELYKEIEELSEQATGVHMTGGVLLAGSQERLEWLKMAHSRNRYLGLNSEILTPSEAYEAMPLIDPKHFVGALWNELEGHLDPSGVTHAYAKAARKNGARVERFTKVEELIAKPEGGWQVITNQGNFEAEHVVNAGGLWAREVGRMVGLELPILAMEHMYLISDDMPEVIAFNEATGREVVHAVDFEGELYLRQEGKGMVMGTYEKAGKPWSELTTPWDFGHELLEPDLDRIAPSLEVGFSHFPAFQSVGIKRIINGPFTFAPDGNPLVGPVKGLQNFWVACGVMAGFSQGGGVGLALANWMTQGDPGFDVWAMDVARYGDWATLAYTNAKVRENYSRRFSIKFPNEELSAGRPHKMTPLYEAWKSQGAVFGDVWGLETPLWFAPPGVEDRFSFHRSTDFETVGEEVRNCREAVGLTETSNFAKYEITGPGAEAWLDHLLPCRLPKQGRMTLAPMLSQAGKLIGDFTLSRLGDEHFFLVGSGPAESYHLRWFQQHLPEDSSVNLKAHGLGLLGLSIAGPNSRELLGRLTNQPVDGDQFRFMDIREMDLGAIPARVGRVSFTGDLGFEFWVTPEYQQSLYRLLIESGEDLGLRPFGGRALQSMRLEKLYGNWAREYRPIYSPYEAGLGRFVALSKNSDFIGRQAAEAAKQEGGRKRQLIGFAVEVEDADALGDEAIWLDDEVVGWVTSGGYGHHVGLSLALGYVESEKAQETDGWELEILGERRKAKRLEQAPFDPAGERLRQ